MTNSITEHKRHTLAHLLAMAVLKKYPNAKLGIGPTIENGFYYDFQIPEGFKESDLKEFEKAMRKAIGGKLATVGKKVTPDQARALFKDQPFKLDLIEEYASEGRELTAYQTGSFFDLCRGGHIDNTGEIDPDSFMLTRIAGAYWRGDETKPQLQRIYGFAFDTKEELEAYIVMLEEAKKRDHKKLGPELDLFTFSELVGPGLPLWTPKGTILRTVLDDFVWSLRRKHGYQKVEIPHISKKDLYETSGHWQKFQDQLFHVTTREGHEFVMKPMNCPHHTQIYARKPHSYRELPQRYANTTMVYRDEQSGELAGLSRVRCITQDDAHVFCRKDQIAEEMEKVWSIIEEFYGAIGFTLSPRLSLSDPAHPENYLGSREVWDVTEQELRALVQKRGVDAPETLGEAAFYGPKIDFMAKDSLGREWQVATIQLDMNMPERFDLTCVNERGEKERIVMIHAAIMGSIERYLSIVIEHVAGAFPLWLAPVQIKILSINDKVLDFVHDVHKKFELQNIRVEIDDRMESIGKKIREAEMQKIPFLLVIGDKEAESNMVSVRERSKGDIGQEDIDKFIQRVYNAIEHRSLP
ncbi:MAG: threonine--tRNA ligase [Patescibacteria group bacterium]